MELRIGDAEREAATQRLNGHFAAGRLDHDAYNERLDAIWTSRTRADLEQLFLDLPWISPRTAPVKPVKPARAGQGGGARRVAMLVMVVLAILVLKEAGKFVVPLVVLWFVFLRPRRQRRPRRDRQGPLALDPRGYLTP